MYQETLSVVINVTALFKNIHIDSIETKPLIEEKTLRSLLLHCSKKK